MVPGNRSGGQWCDSISVISKAPSRTSMPAAYIGRGLAADQLRPGAVSDQRGIQRVVEMRVHWDDSRQPRDADARQASVDPGGRRRDLAHADPAQTGPGEET